MVPGLLFSSIIFKSRIDIVLTYTYIFLQTSWRWLELKLTELSMLDNPHYKISFVLDKSSMFKIDSGAGICNNLILYCIEFHFIYSRVFNLSETVASNMGEVPTFLEQEKYDSYR